MHFLYLCFFNYSMFFCLGLNAEYKGSLLQTLPCQLIHTFTFYQDLVSCRISQKTLPLTKPSVAEVCL